MWYLNAWNSLLTVNFAKGTHVRLVFLMNISVWQQRRSRHLPLALNSHNFLILSWQETMMQNFATRRHFQLGQRTELWPPNPTQWHSSPPCLHHFAFRRGLVCYVCFLFQSKILWLQCSQCFARNHFQIDLLCSPSLSWSCMFLCFSTRTFGVKADMVVDGHLTPGLIHALLCQDFGTRMASKCWWFREGLQPYSLNLLRTTSPLPTCSFQNGDKITEVFTLNLDTVWTSMSHLNFRKHISPIHAEETIY